MKIYIISSVAVLLAGSETAHVRAQGQCTLARSPDQCDTLTDCHWCPEKTTGFCAPKSQQCPADLSVWKTAEDWNFLVMGDWGGQPIFPYTTPEEKKTANGMGSVGSAHSSKYCLTLGDNFYYDGVKSTEDHRWKSTFENVFTDPSLQSDDYFRVLLGNHDHNGNTTAQVQYSNISKKWRMDDLYWSFSEKIPVGDKTVTLDTIMIDTVIWSGSEHYFDDEGNMHSVNGDQLPGPSDPIAADKQKSWLEDKLKNSFADYVIVAGHYPVYSICEHGPTNILVEELIPLLEKYNVSAYLNGHDHCQELVDTSDKGGLQFHTIGSAHVNSADVSHKSSVPDGSLKWHVGTEDGQTGGFGRITINADGMTVQHYAGNGTVVYTAPTISSRKSH